jgi:hypothetical protein
MVRLNTGLFIALALGCLLSIAGPAHAAWTAAQVTVSRSGQASPPVWTSVSGQAITTNSPGDTGDVAAGAGARSGSSTASGTYEFQREYSGQMGDPQYTVTIAGSTNAEADAQGNGANGYGKATLKPDGFTGTELVSESNKTSMGPFVQGFDPKAANYSVPSGILLIFEVKFDVTVNATASVPAGVEGESRGHGHSIAVYSTP